MTFTNHDCVETLSDQIKEAEGTLTFCEERLEKAKAAGNPADIATAQESVDNMQKYIAMLAQDMARWAAKMRG